MTDPDDGAWFAPKAFGYGAGLPIAWQGWVAMALHILVIVGPTLLLNQSSPVAAVVYALVLALLPMPLYAAKTRGGWHWRWGRRD